jgi:hypothetical protein
VAPGLAVVTIFRALCRGKPITHPPLSPQWRCSAGRKEWWPVTVAQRIISKDQVGSAKWPGWAQPDGFGAVPCVGEWAVPDQHPVRHQDPQPPRRLVLFGLPPVLAEPVTMLAEILGWQVESFPSGLAVCPPARLCLAMLPASPGERGPIAAWSPELNLNELISQVGLSIMDQPLCITRVEQMLETLVCEP